MELDFSDKIRELKFSSKSESLEQSNAEVGLETKKDNPEMAMKNKSVCKICGTAWGSCMHASDMSNMSEQEDDSEECSDCECGKSPSECSCADCGTKMEKSNSAKDKNHPDKEDKKDVESEKKNPEAEKEEEKDKKKFPFNKSKASLPEKIANMLLKKLNFHNEKYQQNISFSQLNKVYSRGLKSSENNYKPTIKPHQWAVARVNLFLKMMSGGNVDLKYSVLDSDVAKASDSNFIESGLDSYDFSNFSELEFQLAKISLVEAGLSEVEMDMNLSEAEDKKKVNKTLNKPFRLPSGSKKKFGVYVKNDKGNVVMVKFGDPNMSIKRDDPERRKSYRARHGCDNPGPKWKANYWSCKMWSKTPVSKLTSSENCNCGCGECEEIDIENLVEIEGAKKGLWDNIREKKKRMGKNYKPAKPGDKDRPNPEAWKKAQADEYDWDGEEEFNQEELLLLDPSLANVEIFEE